MHEAASTEDCRIYTDLSFLFALNGYSYSVIKQLRPLCLSRSLEC